MIQPDVGQAGGITELKKIAAMAETYYIGLAPHNPYGPVNTMAAIHIDASTPNFLIQEGGHAPWYDAILKEPFPGTTDGYFDVPTVPGLGLDVDEEALARHPYNPKPDVAPGGYGGAQGIASRQQNTWV